jgi:hypothetical protein
MIVSIAIPKGKTFTPNNAKKLHENPIHQTTNKNEKFKFSFSKVSLGFNSKYNEIRKGIKKPIPMKILALRCKMGQKPQGFRFHPEIRSDSLRR